LIHKKKGILQKHIFFQTLKGKNPKRVIISKLKRKKTDCISIEIKKIDTQVENTIIVLDVLIVFSLSFRRNNLASLDIITSLIQYYRWNYK